MRHRTPTSLLLLALAFDAIVAASATPGRAEMAEMAAKSKDPKPSATEEVRHPEDLFVVDCLLPAQIRRLGRSAKFLAPRQVVRTTAHDCQLRGGEYTLDRARNDFALQAWLEQAKSGDAEAANNVGEIYEQGVRGTPDPEQAAVWYRKAAEGGSRRAQRNLAFCYENGYGLAADPVQAIVWYRKAAGLAGETDLDLEKEIAALRAEVTRLAGEAETARADLARSAGELAAARTALGGAERELAAAKSALAAATKPAPSTSTTSTATAAKKKEAEVAVVTRQKAVDAERARVAQLEAAQDRYRRLATELEASASSAKELAGRGREALLTQRAPAIEFLRPDVLATRGPALVPVPAGASEVEIVGKVTAELGLVEFTAAGEAREVGSDGVFRLRVPVEPGRTIPFVAIDRAARRTEAELVFGGGTAAVPASLPGGPSVPASAPGRRFHALVLSGGAYRKLAPLQTALADGDDLAKLLRSRFGFEVTSVPDATFLEAMRRLTELAKRLGPEDDLLVYFAGHGRIDPATGRGFWLPVDADPEDPSTWIPNDALAKIFGTMRAGRILVVADSCYAGTLGGGALERAAAAAPAKSGARVRSVLSSGGLAPVLDQGGAGHSIFARALLTVLSLAQDPISADRLYQAVAARVGYRSAELGAPQRPEYAPIGFAGHEGGDFVFQPRS